MRENDESGFSDPVKITLSPQKSHSELYARRFCPPFVNCLSLASDEATESKFEVRAETKVGDEHSDPVDLGTQTFVTVPYSGSLIETAGVLGIGPASVVARNFLIKFSREKKAVVEFVPRASAQIPNNTLTIQIKENSEAYSAPEGSSITFLMNGEEEYATPPSIPIIFDPTLDYSVFPLSILAGLVSSQLAPYKARVVSLPNGQLAVPLYLFQGFNLTLPSGQSIPLTDGVRNLVRVPQGTFPGIGPQMAATTDYKFVSGADAIIIGGSILKQDFVASIILDGYNKRIYIQEDSQDRDDEYRPELPTSVPLELPAYPATAGIQYHHYFTQLVESIIPISSEPLDGQPREPFLSLRPYLSHPHIVQNKYYLHTMAPIPIVAVDIEGVEQPAIGYILECSEFVQNDFQEPEITNFPALFQIDPSSDGGVVTWQDSGHVHIPIVFANANDPGQIYKLRVFKTRRNVIIFLIPQN